MKNLLDTLKSARWIEILILCAITAIMMVMVLGTPSANSSSVESRMERMLSSVSGAGRVQVMQGGEEGGILILSEGAEDVSVMLALQRAVHTLTGLPIEKIEIAKSE